MKRYLILIIILGLLGCKRSPDNGYQAVFFEQSELGVYKNESAILTYNEELHQMCCDGVGYTYFRYQTDDQTVYINISGLGNLTEESEFELDVISKGLDIEAGKLHFSVKKVKDDKVWLWSNDQSLGLIIPSKL